MKDKKTKENLYIDSTFNRHNGHVKCNIYSKDGYTSIQIRNTHLCVREILNRITDKTEQLYNIYICRSSINDDIIDELEKNKIKLRILKCKYINKLLPIKGEDDESK